MRCLYLLFCGIVALSVCGCAYERQYLPAVDEHHVEAYAPENQSTKGEFEDFIESKKSKKKISESEEISETRSSKKKNKKQSDKKNKKKKQKGRQRDY